MSNTTTLAPTLLQIPMGVFGLGKAAAALAKPEFYAPVSDGSVVGDCIMSVDNFMTQGEGVATPEIRDRVMRSLDAAELGYLLEGSNGRLWPNDNTSRNALTSVLVAPFSAKVMALARRLQEGKAGVPILGRESGSTKGPRAIVHNGLYAANLRKAVEHGYLREEAAAALAFQLSAGVFANVLNLVKLNEKIEKLSIFGGIAQLSLIMGVFAGFYVPSNCYGPMLAIFMPCGSFIFLGSLIPVVAGIKYLLSLGLLKFPERAEASVRYALLRQIHLLQGYQDSFPQVISYPIGDLRRVGILPAEK